GRYPALVLNTPEDGLLAYSAVCTHFACLVKWNPESGMIECPCHEGYFSPSDGSVISGPPPEPLEIIQLFIEDDTIFIGGEA
ncbi:MAG: ubiquinol-cytochrome c reductase iron-sulfur subunit, partial [Anaerolineaceae bacterium]